MRKRYAVAMAFAALMIAPPIWLQTSNELVTGATCLYVLVSGICTILAWLVGRRWGFRGKFGLVHLGFAVGISLEFIGNLAWTIYELVLKIQVPFPSFADVFFLVRYLPIAIGMGQFLRTFRGRKWKRWDFVFLGVGLFYLGLVCVLLIGPLIVSAESPLDKSIDVAHPVLDSVLVVLALFMFSAFKGGRMSGAWVWIALGSLLIGLHDVLFSVGLLEGVRYSELSSLRIEFWMFACLGLWGFISLGLGFAQQITEVA